MMTFGVFSEIAAHLYDRRLRLPIITGDKQRGYEPCVEAECITLIRTALNRYWTNGCR